MKNRGRIINNDEASIFAFAPVFFTSAFTCTLHALASLGTRHLIAKAHIPTPDTDTYSQRPRSHLQLHIETPPRWLRAISPTAYLPKYGTESTNAFLKTYARAPILVRP